MKYKYLETNKKRKNKKKYAFFVKIFVLIVLIILLLIIGAFLFYKKLTDSSSMKKSESISSVLQIDTKNSFVNSENKKLQNEKSNQSEKDFENLCDKDFSNWNKKAPYLLRIVNRGNYLSADFAPPSLVNNLDNLPHTGNVKISSEIYEPLLKMFSDAKKDGMNLKVVSGYRSYEYQDKLFRDQIKLELKSVKNYEKATKKAATVVAKPGQSEHNLGLAVDINSVEGSFKNTAEYKWLSKNAHKYGFIERYTKENQKNTGVIPEPWHYRYVGKYADEVRKYKSLEEYVNAKNN